MNCKCCHKELVDDKRHWKKFCSNECKAEFEEKGPRLKKKDEKSIG